MMFVLFLLGDLAGGWLSVPGLTGFGFAAGSAIAAGCARRKDLLIVAATPPLTYLAAVTCAELVNAHADHAGISVSSIGTGVFLTLSAAAPWMFAGLTGALVIAAARGLRQCVRDSLAGLAGETRR